MTVWTPEKINQASVHWRQGATAGQIAGVFGASRNSVLGIAVRRRDLFPERLVPKIPTLAEIERAAAAKAERQRQQAINLRAAELGEDGGADPEPLKPRVEYVAGLDSLRPGRDPDGVPGEPVGLLKLNDRCCHWPVAGERQDALFCGGRIELGAVYCGAHRRLAYQPRAGEVGR